MTHLLILIPLSIVMGLVGLAAFIWALRNDQFEDPEGNAHRVLLNDDPPQPRTPSKYAASTKASDSHRSSD